MNDGTYILTLSCPDKVGIVHAVTAFLAAAGCNIMSAHQYGDPESVLFFMRIHFRAEAGAPGQDELRARFAPVAENFEMRWQLRLADEKTRALVLVSRQGHCLNDLIFRTRNGELPLEIAAIASNHGDYREFAGWHGVPYHFLPVTAQTRAEQEQRLRNVIKGENVQLVILARYMQILSEGLCRDLAGRCINIHHSFLPGFKGARPYHQAHAHGVKLIGATAHYVTASLDEGPIIEQDVQRVDHAHSPEELAAIGRDIEAVVLARAVKYHTEHRVLINGRKTVVLR